jgi:hypothetical protein
LPGIVGLPAVKPSAGRKLTEGSLATEGYLWL